MSMFNFDEIKKAISGLFSKEKIVIISSIIFLFVTIVYPFFFKETGVPSSQANDNLQKNNNNQNIPITIHNGDTNGGADKEDNVKGAIGINKEFDKTDWSFDKNIIEEEKDSNGKYTGYFCVKKSSAFPSREIWYKDKIPVNSEVSLRYLVKSKNKNISPKIIFVFGENKTFRIFFPDSDNKFVGFEDNSDISKSKNLKPSRLSRKVDVSMEAVAKITIENKPAQSNNAIFTYELSYIPLAEDDELNSVPKNENDSDVFLVSLPWVNPSSPGAEQKIGFGVFNETCLKPIWFTLRYPN